MGLLKVMSQEHGDEVVLAWDQDDPQTHKKVTKKLKKLLNEHGVTVHRVEVTHGRRVGEQIVHEDEFDPAATEYLATAPMAGG